MSVTCGVCDLECMRDGLEIHCDGNCGTVCHANCGKADIEGKKTRAGQWKCKTCRSLGSMGVVSVEDSGLKEFIAKTMQSFKEDILNEVKKIRSEMNELGTSVEFFSAQIDKANELMSEVKLELEETRKKNRELSEKCIGLAKEVDEMNERVRSLEQYTRKNNVEISGIPVTANEDVLCILKDLGSALGVEVNEDHIMAAHRIPSFRKDREPALIVQFQKKQHKDSWITKFREVKSFTADRVNPRFSKKNVYINDHLCPENKVFLSKLKSKCSEIGYMYAWCRDGKFFIRKKQGDKCIKVGTFAEIDKLK